MYIIYFGKIGLSEWNMIELIELAFNKTFLYFSLRITVKDMDSKYNIEYEMDEISKYLA